MVRNRISINAGFSRLPLKWIARERAFESLSKNDLQFVREAEPNAKALKGGLGTLDFDLWVDNICFSYAMAEATFYSYLKWREKMLLVPPEKRHSFDECRDFTLFNLMQKTSPK